MAQQRAVDEVGPGVSATLLTWRAPMTPDAAPIDLAAAERAAADLLIALGQPVESGGIGTMPRAGFRWSAWGSR